MRQLRALLEHRFPSAAPREVNVIITSWKAAYDLYLSEMYRAAGADINWREFFNRHSTPLAEWTSQINVLVDEELKLKFGARLVGALQASRHTRHDDLPSGDAETIARLAKKFAATPENHPNLNQNQNQRQNQNQQQTKKITTCIGCKAKVIGNHVEFFKAHNPKCPKKAKI